MKKLIVLSIVACMALGVTAAFAQSNASLNTIKLGIVYPTDKGVRSATEDVWFYGSVEREFLQLENAVITGEIGYTKASGSDEVIPLLANYKAYGADTGSARIYYGAGAGVYFSDGDSEFGVAPFIGYDAGKYTLELKWHLPDFDTDNSLLGLTFGWKF